MLLLYSGPFSGINESMVRAWQEAVPDLTIVPRDLLPVAWGSPRDKLAAVPTGLRRDGVRVLFGGAGRLWDSVRRSRWYTERLDRAIRRIQEAEEYDFSLAMGTILPVRAPRRPNFVYTDHAILANKRYNQSPDHFRLWAEALPYERETLQRASKVFAMSEHVVQTLCEDYGLSPEKVECVGAGCNIPNLEPPAADRFERRNVVFVGVDWERKGGPELLEAFGRVRARLENATLTIVGCQPNVSAPNVTVVGPVPSNRVSYYLAHATVFAMPSRREPFGIVFLEAMRAGLPVVALNLGATPDFVIDGETGYKVDPGDVDALAQRLEMLLGDPEKCRDMGQRARALVESRYSWERAQQAMWASIREVLSRDGRADHVDVG